jgi:hypothetical protein
VSTPLLDAELERFGRDLAAGATPVPARRGVRRLSVAVAVAVLLLVPGAIAGVDALFLTDDRPHLEPPPGYTVPKVTGPAVPVTAGELPAGSWAAYAVRCGERASVVVVSPTGSRTSAACGAVPPGGEWRTPPFVPSTFYDGEIQTTFIYAAVPASVARVRIELPGGVRETATTAVPDAAKTLGLDVRFVVLAVPGNAHVREAIAFVRLGHVLSRCDDDGHCANGG